MTATEPFKQRVEFKTVREDWSEYKTSDETHIKVKTSISEILETSEPKSKNQFKLDFVTSTSFFKEPSPDDKGEPSADQKISEADILLNLSLQKIAEPLCIYDIVGKTILTQITTLKQVLKTSKFDNNGNRIYQYDVSCQLGMMPYPKVPEAKMSQP